MERDFAWGGGPMMQCADVLLRCTLNLYSFANQCHPNKFSFFKKCPDFDDKFYGHPTNR